MSTELYLAGIGKGGAHAVASRHGFRKDGGTLKVWVDDPQAADTCLHNHVGGKVVQACHLLFIVTEWSAVSVRVYVGMWLLAFWTLVAKSAAKTHHPISLSVATIMLSTSSILNYQVWHSPRRNLWSYNATLLNSADLPMLSAATPTRLMWEASAHA